MKSSSYRIAGCGIYPNYYLNGTSLNEKNILYLVSVGKEKFEGKWVDRFVNFIKEIKPKKTFIIVADSLQRFNIELEENLSEIAAFEESKNRGKKWVNKYESYFSNSYTNYEFIYWDDLKQDEDFGLYMDEIINLSLKNTPFKEALFTSSNEYIQRHSRLNFNVLSDQEKAKKKSCDFLKEECAVFHVLAKINDNIAIVYPGPATKILTLSIEHINKKYRMTNPFYWLNMRPTKEKKKINLSGVNSFFREFSPDKDQSFSKAINDNLKNNSNINVFDNSL